MDLFILRHGIAVELGAGGCKRDSERYLTGEGKRKVRQVARLLAKLDVHIDAVLASPYVRARETAELVREECKCKHGVQVREELIPGGSIAALIRGINRMDPQPGTLLLVGHEPYLSSLISLLVSGELTMGLELKKAGLCRMSVGSLKASRCATLEWLLAPRQASLIG